MHTRLAQLLWLANKLQTVLNMFTYMFVGYFEGEIVGEILDKKDQYFPF